MAVSSNPPPHKIGVQQLSLRRMKQSDVEGIMKIESVSFGRHHWSEDTFFNEIKNNIGRYYTLLRQNSDEVLGYCGFWLVFDEAHVTTVAVDHQYRGNALGELLVVHMLDTGMRQSVKWLTLEVRASNNPAQNLYYKYGFQSVGVRARYYQDNQEDALIMTTPDLLSKEYRLLYNKHKATLEERLGGFPEGFGY